MTQTDDGHAHARAEVIATLGGPVAQRMALCGSEPGFRRRLTREQVVAFHEAGHIVAAAALGRYFYHVTIVPDRAVKIQKTGHVGGAAWYGSQSNPNWTPPDSKSRVS